MKYILSGLYCANDRLDPGVEVLHDGLKEVTSLLSDHLRRLNCIEQSIGIQENDPHRHGLKSAFSQNDIPDDTQIYRIPKKTTAGLDYFMSLPFVKALLPEPYQRKSLVSDSVTASGSCDFPNLDRTRVESLITTYLAEIHPFHPVMEIKTINHLSSSVCEAGLEWTPESALILQILAVGAIYASQPYTDYYSSAIRRMGFATQNPGIIASQFYYLQGFVSHLFCF